jgi:anhydro-N-acetylmuramic acid kinase
MVYSVMGLMSGSSLDGLDIVHVQLSQHAGKWTFEILNSACYPYPEDWIDKLRNAVNLTALDYQLLHTAYGHYIGDKVNGFIQENELQYKVQLIGSHGHTTFHLPEKRMTAQLGDGAAIAATTGINVISDLRAMDVAFGGQGAPIVPIGERLLFPEHELFLNLGGIANISAQQQARTDWPENHSQDSKQTIAFDICPANAVLNLLANELGQAFDVDGYLAANARVNEKLLQELNRQPYYDKAFPKSLANNFGTETIFPIIISAGLGIPDSLRTYIEHICIQVDRSVKKVLGQSRHLDISMFVTGGGAFNLFLMKRLKEILAPSGIQVFIPDDGVIKYKEALIMALIATLRWREEINVLSSVTGAVRDTIGGALWMGQHG